METHTHRVVRVRVTGGGSRGHLMLPIAHKGRAWGGLAGHRPVRDTWEARWAGRKRCETPGKPGGLAGSGAREPVRMRSEQLSRARATKTCARSSSARPGSEGASLLSGTLVGNGASAGAQAGTGETLIHPEASYGANTEALVGGSDSSETA